MFSGRKHAIYDWYRQARPFLLSALLSAASGCSEPTTTSSDRNFVGNRREIPIGRIPAIAETARYRCKTSDVYVDYFRDGTGAVLRTRDGARVRFTAISAGGPFISQDQTLERGDRGIVLTGASVPSQNCGALK